MAWEEIWQFVNYYTQTLTQFAHDGILEYIQPDIIRSIFASSKFFLWNCNRSHFGKYFMNEISFKITNKVSQFAVFLSNLFTTTEQIISGSKSERQWISIWPLLQFHLKNLCEAKINLIMSGRIYSRRKNVVGQTKKAQKPRYKINYSQKFDKSQIKNLQFFQVR